MPKKNRKLYMQKSEKHGQSSIARKMVEDMVSGNLGEQSDEQYEQSTALTDALFAAHENGDTAEFDRIREKLGALGCEVQFKSDGTFSVLFPTQGFI